MIRISSLLLLCAYTVWAQTPTMHIKKKDGTTVSFPVQDIQKLTFTGTTSASDRERMHTAVATLALFQNYPNPFNPATRIQYRLDNAADVSLTIVNISGQLVRSYPLGRLNAGPHESGWDGKDAQGRPVASGAYLCVLRAGAYVLSKKMMLIR